MMMSMVPHSLARLHNCARCAGDQKMERGVGQGDLEAAAQLGK